MSMEGTFFGMIMFLLMSTRKETVQIRFFCLGGNIGGWRKRCPGSLFLSLKTKSPFYPLGKHG